MAIKEILVLGDDRLREKAKKISRFDKSVQALIDDMFETMYAANGLGLAATQIGVPLRVIIIEMPEERDEEGNITSAAKQYVLCNPEIVRARGEDEVQEACLSVPGYVGRVKRATEVVVKAQDAEGRNVRYRGRDLLAQAFQHELDHLDGVLYVDRIESPDDLWQVNVDIEDEETDEPEI